VQQRGDGLVLVASMLEDQRGNGEKVAHGGLAGLRADLPPMKLERQGEGRR
jgi:hypothetical protein